MSANGDSTRDWLLKKLLKAKESLVEQSREIRDLGSRLAKANSLVQDLEQTNIQLAGTTTRFAERVDELEFEVQQLKKVPPIAPNLNVYYKSVLGDVDKLRVTSVSSANGQTTIHTEPSRARR